MKRSKALWLALVLIVLPIVGRLLWFYRGWYRPPYIPEVEDVQIELLEPAYHPFVDQPIEGWGRVVIDVSHENNLETDDLAPLRDRLTARGVTIESFDGASVSLETQLRGATALVVIAPTSGYTADEREAIVNFVADGGRLLLAADPTRPVPPEEEEGALDFESVLFPTSAIPAINGLANAFGVIYFDDYLYNLVDNEGNYRNVKLANLDAEHPLTKDLEEVVFFAAHSLRTDDLSLISGDENTLSPLRVGETDLTAAALAAEGRVLALGDVTLLTPPYHTIGDNDHFLSNIADWLATGEREWNLKDFPYLFEGPVDLVQISEGLLDPRLIARSDPLEAVFDRADLSLNLRATADPDHDTLFVGTFDNVELVQEYLATAGVAVTMVGAEDEGTVTDKEEEPQDTIEIEGLGTIAVEGTTLFVVDRSTDHVVVIALAQDGEMAIEALERLASADFSGCVHSGAVTVCSTGEIPKELEPEAGGEPEQPPRVGVTSEGPPRIASLSEAETAFQAQTPWLEDLAAESYDITSQAGETYTYTITMDRSRDVMWVYGWCATTKELLAQNWDHISLVFTLDGEEVPLDSFVELESIFDEMECRLYYTLLSDWPGGEHLLTTEVTFRTTINDGLDDYPAGTHVYEYRVSVAD